MTTDFVWAYEDRTVAQAINNLRHYQGQIESIYTVFLVDAEERLTGRGALKQAGYGGADDAAYPT